MVLDPGPRATERPGSSNPEAPEASGEPEGRQGPAGPPVFAHPQWMVGVVLILGVAALVAGLSNPVWFLVGSPFILTLAIYLWVRFLRPQ